MTCVLVTSRSWNEILVKQRRENRQEFSSHQQKKIYTMDHLEKINPQLRVFLTGHTSSRKIYSHLSV